MSTAALQGGRRTGAVTQAAAPAACLHCGALVEGADYCCDGCELAASIIRDAGLARYYAEREAPAPRPGAAEGGWTAVPVKALGDGSAEAHLQIDGLRCASCVWVTERVLEQVDGVCAAQVSYATGRATLRWDPAATNLEALAGRVAALGYRPRPLDEAPGWDRDLLVRMGVACFSAANVMMLSAGIYLGWLSGIEERYAALFRWVNLALATPVALWSAEPFYRGAISGLRHRVLHMDLPVSLGVLLLYGHGLASTLRGADGYLDSMCMLVALLLAGRVIEQRGRQRAADAARSLAARAPARARRAVGDRVETVDAGALAPGDRLEIASGEEVAADGVVIAGRGELLRTLLTGESRPEPVGPGDRVIAGAVLESGAVSVEVEACGADTLLARMAEGLAEAQSRPVASALADRIAPYFTAAVLGLAAAGYAGWRLAAGPEVALEVAIAVLVVACPCALALSSPLAVAAGLGAAARRGLLLRGGDALRRLAEVDRVVLDKTGTVTGGAPRVVEVDDATLRLAAGLERSSIHPVARAILEEAAARRIPIPLSADVREIPGVGVEGEVDGQRWSLRRAGPGEVALLDDAGLERGRIRLADQLREDARRDLEALAALGLAPELLTGDHAAVARAIAAEAGVAQVRAEATPDDKVARLEALRAEGYRPLFVGDGLNDGPALVAAHVGVAMGGGAASSVLVADGVVAAESLSPLLAGLRAARAADVAVQRNLRRSLIYNMLAVAAALSGVINPLVAAVLMPFSSAMVLWGSSRVEREVAALEA